jgi:signal peptidase I
MTRGDLIVFSSPQDRTQTAVKPVVGMPGDHIRISHKVLYRYGAAEVEPYVRRKTDYEDLYRDNFPSEPNGAFAAWASEMLTKHVSGGEVVVPESNYFVLGDNRDFSLDSRYWGFVNAADVIGRLLFIYDSEEVPSAGRTNVENDSSLRLHHVRWGRLFKRP